MEYLDRTYSVERWDKLRDIYAQALDTPSEERSDLVHLLCAEDSQIESEINEMLSARIGAGSFLLEPALQALQLLPAREIEDRVVPGTVLSARFHIRSHLNSGGMGSVYEAWDCELLEAVALKIIRPELRLIRRSSSASNSRSSRPDR